MPLSRNVYKSWKGREGAAIQNNRKNNESAPSHPFYTTPTPPHQARQGVNGTKLTSCITTKSEQERKGKNIIESIGENWIKCHTSHTTLPGTWGQVQGDTHHVY